MRVYLCEKPSQARDIAGVLGSPQQADGHLRVNDAVVTWCIGHLFTQAEPDDYDPELKRWRLETLPIMPSAWKLKPQERVARQIRVIRDLLRNAEEVVIATDPDREGEVIGREVLEELGYRGRITRLLLNALDPVSIRKGLEGIQDGAATKNLYFAGLGRSRADWLVGMNLTRAWTIVGRERGWDGVMSIGRVQTPTLNLIVQRDARIENFIPADYFTVGVECRHSTEGPFRAAWVPNEQQLDAFCDSEGRCINRSAAEQAAEKIKGGAGLIVASQKTMKRENPPLLFSLSELQQTASKRWGYGAKETLEIAQALYEKHKAITYPRTDCGYLPEDQHADAKSVIAALKTSFAGEGKIFDSVEPERKSSAWNDTKVTAHHGMIPTLKTQQTGSLTDPERNIFREIGLRYLMQFCPDHVFEQISLDIEAGGERLAAKGREIVTAGWKALMATQDGQKPPECVPLLAKGEAVVIEDAQVVDRQTKPPARFTEGTLIKAMTRIAAEVADSDMRAILREHDGIGTEATRAEIIQTLKNREYIQTRKKVLLSTKKGRELIAAIPGDLKDPATTALMERMLAEVAEGTVPLEAFLKRQGELVAKWVENAKNGTAVHGGPPPGRDGKTELGPCPKCGQELRKRRGKFGAFVGCSGYPKCGYIQKREKSASRQASGKTGKVCSVCGNAMIVRKGLRGKFLGCSAYPQCRHTEQTRT